MSIFKALKKNPGSSQSDLLRRRRRKTLITNIVIISVLSIVAALVITWQSGGAGFSLENAPGRSTMATAPRPSAARLIVRWRFGGQVWEDGRLRG